MNILSLALATALLASPNASTRMTVTPTELPAATMAELSRVAVAPVAGERRERPRRALTSIASAENAVAATMVVAPLAAAAPAITRSFQAVTDPLPGANFGVDPADAGGAVSAQYVVGAFNNAVTVHDRNGNLLSQIAESQFWHDSAQPDKFIYDPRVAYDAANDRWVLVALGDDGDPQVNGVIFIGISTSGNPAAGWRRLRLKVDQSGFLDGDITHLAITTTQIAVSFHVYDGDFKENTTIFTIPKSTAFGTGNITVTGDVLPPEEDLMPLSSDDATLRMVSWEGDTRLRTFELLPSGSTANAAEWTTSPLPNVPPPCGQLGAGSAPDCFGVAMNGISRGGTMWIAQTTSLYATLIWRISGNTAKTFVIQDSARAVVFPSVAANRRGGALVGFVLMSPQTYISTGYAYIDPAGNVSAPAILKAGEATFRRDRWGDFTTTVVDPVDDMSFWTLGNYANTPFNSTYDRWATWWGFVKIADTPARRHAAGH
jgi:hypothetical protein